MNESKRGEEGEVYRRVNLKKSAKASLGGGDLPS